MQSQTGPRGVKRVGQSPPPHFLTSYCYLLHTFKVARLPLAQLGHFRDDEICSRSINIHTETDKVKTRAALLSHLVKMDPQAACFPLNAEQSQLLAVAYSAYRHFK